MSSVTVFPAKFPDLGILITLKNEFENRNGLKVVRTQQTHIPYWKH